jgi:hypothetical protein
MEKVQSILGGLVQFNNKEEFNLFLEKMNPNEAFTVIEFALLYAQKQGSYSFEESHVIYKCLNKLKINEENNLPDNLPDNNNNGDTNK